MAEEGLHAIICPLAESDASRNCLKGASDSEGAAPEPHASFQQAGRQALFQAETLWPRPRGEGAKLNQE